MVALVQRLLAFDGEGELHATPIPLVVQLRALGTPPPDAPEVGVAPPYPAGWPYQSFAELRLDRRRLLSGASALVALAPDEPAYDLLGAHGDEIRFASHGRAPVARLSTCVACHGATGAMSLNVFTRTATGPGGQLGQPRNRAPRVLVGQTLSDHAARALRFQRERYEWGLLRGIWAALD